MPINKIVSCVRHNYAYTTNGKAAAHVPPMSCPDYLLPFYLPGTVRDKIKETSEGPWSRLSLEDHWIATAQRIHTGTSPETTSTARLSRILPELCLKKSNGHNTVGSSRNRKDVINQTVLSKDFKSLLYRGSSGSQSLTGKKGLHAVCHSSWWRGQPGSLFKGMSLISTCRARLSGRNVGRRWQLNNDIAIYTEIIILSWLVGN